MQTDKTLANLKITLHQFENACKTQQPYRKMLQDSQSYETEKHNASSTDTKGYGCF